MARSVDEMPASWLDPRLEIRPSVIHGRGTFATAPIAAGETVSVWAHRILFPSDVSTAPPGEL
jgi:SET domain-containing protein